MGNSKKISFIVRSKRRIEILRLLVKGEKSQSEIMKITKMYKAHTSRTIKELLEKKLVICTNPGDRVFKFYKVTFLGKKVLMEVEKFFS